MISVRKLLMFFCVAAVVLAALTPLSAGLLWAILVPILFLVGTLAFVWSERLPQEKGAVPPAPVYRLLAHGHLPSLPR